jgi:foldase protein PrsA
VSRARLISLTPAAVAIAVCLQACGGGGAKTGETRLATVIHVGAAPIQNATIAHWMTVLSPQHVLPLPPHFTACVSRQRVDKPSASKAELEHACLERYQAVRQEALSFLISSRWLTEEAAAQGAAVTPAEVQQRLERKRKSYSTEAEFKESLSAIARSVPDLRLELEAELAQEKLRRKLAAEEPKISPAAVAAYYRAHAQQYHIPEERYFDIGENFPSAAFAKKVMRETNAGKPLPSLHEKLPRKPYTDYNGEKRTIVEAIFKATPNVVTGPIELNGYFFVIDITRVRPAYVQRLAQVKGAIAKKLAAEQRKRTLAAFIAAWRKRWIARTDCATGYVVQQCRQYTGARAPEEPLAFN